VTGMLAIVAVPGATKMKGEIEVCCWFAVSFLVLVVWLSSVERDVGTFPPRRWVAFALVPPEYLDLLVWI
jgi:hypothetical protein